MEKRSSVWRRQAEEVQREIAEACRRSGRPADAVRLVAVTKTLEPSAVPDLIDAGLRDLGENRWQQAKEKLAQPGAGKFCWHFVGHLQSNKVKYVVRHFHWIHSIHSEELGRLIGAAAVREGREVLGLVQVNVAGEAQKSGVAPEQTRHVVRALLGIQGLRLRGLMTMAPQTDQPETVRWVFAALRALRDEVQKEIGEELPELSMGMSGDFLVAVEEGATMVRIGRRLFPQEPAGAGHGEAVRP